MPTSVHVVLSLLRSHAVPPGRDNPVTSYQHRFTDLRAVERIIAKTTAMQNEISQWRPLSVSTDGEPAQK